MLRLHLERSPAEFAEMKELASLWQSHSNRAPSVHLQDRCRPKSEQLVADSGRLSTQCSTVLPNFGLAPSGERNKLGRTSNRWGGPRLNACSMEKFISLSRLRARRQRGVKWLKSSQLFNSTWKCDEEWAIPKWWQRSYQGGDIRIPLPRWFVWHVWRQKSKWVDSLYLYDNTHRYACTWKDTTYANLLLNFYDVTFFCKIGLYYTFASINQLFNTKNSFLQLLCRKATLKLKFYLNQYFSQTSSHEIVRRNVKSTRKILNLDNKINHLSPVYKKKISKSCADDSKASLVSSCC